MNTPRLRAAAFSLSELLVVVAVILVLIAVLIVGVDGVYTRGMQVKCQHNLEQIGQALQMYAAKSQGLMPMAWDVRSQRRWYETLAATCIDNAAVIACPLEPAPPIQTTVSAPVALSDPIYNTLCWLKKVQGAYMPTSPSWYPGGWDVYSWGGTGHGTTGASGHQTGVAAVALMAFLGYGCTDRYPADFADTVSKAITFLLNRQDRVVGSATEGKFTGYDNGGKWYLYDQGTATMAMAMAYASTGRADCKNAAELGLKHLLQQQSPSGGWGYLGGADDSDMSITGWAIQALHACDMFGLSATDGGVNLVAQAKTRLQTAFANMCFGYPTSDPTNYSGRYRYYPETIQNGYISPCTAISLTTRLLMGHRPAATSSMTTDSGRCKGVRDYLHPGDYPAIARQTTGMLYYYYYMTLANSLLGGADWTEWTSPQGTNPPVFPDAFLKLQDVDKNSSTYGSWPPTICTWGTYGGRVYTSALSVLALEAGLPGHWEVQAATGQCSYGYNTHLGDDRRVIAADTILVMDYSSWVINKANYDATGALDPSRNDTPDYIALRHGGKANVLFGDGHVRALAISEFTDGMWTTKFGD